MTNISKKTLDEKELQALFKQLGQLMATTKPDQTELFLHELLGFEERVMLAKRLAAVIILSRGASIYKTAITLSMSTSTISKLYERLEAGSYTNVLKTVNKKNKTAIDFLTAIDSILHLGGVLPHYNGRERYRGRGG